ESAPFVQSASETTQNAGEDASAIDNTENTAPASMDRPGSRFTTGRAEITNVQFINGEGNEAKAFETGQPLTIRIFYEAKEEIKNPVFGLALYTQAGVHLNGPNTRFAGLDVPAIHGSGYVDYTMPELPLLSGIYDVTVALTAEEMVDVLDHQHRTYGFYVQPTVGMAERWGLLNIDSVWSFHPEK
ncbi:MAG: Wzt carbohydrate-binding domain-containing protein, partial [Chloroflexia bacterium]